MERLVENYVDLFDRKFCDDGGTLYTLFGIVRGADGFYFGMVGEAGVLLVPCSIDIEDHGFFLLPEA